MLRRLGLPTFPVITSLIMFPILISAQTILATGSIAGTVLESSNTSPLKQVAVRILSGPTIEDTVTDLNGQYRLSNLAPGTYTLMAVHGRVTDAKTVRVAQAQDLTGVHFHLPAIGEIEGQVLDDNGEPVPGIIVSLLSREYRLGRLHYSVQGFAKTDDMGRYDLYNVAPGHAYLLYARRTNLQVPAISQAPEDPHFRAPEDVSTFYPSTSSTADAVPVSVHPGERREGIDIRLLRTPSYCIEGMLMFENIPLSANFRLIDRQLSDGPVGFSGAIRGQSDPKGRLRICGVGPGDYQLAVYRHPTAADGNVPLFGSTPLSVTDSDVRRLQLPAVSRAPLTVKAQWDGPRPKERGEITIDLAPVSGAYLRGIDTGLRMKTSVPGVVTYPALRIDEYEVRIGGLTGNSYIKSASYGNNDVLREPMRFGSAIGGGDLTIVAGSDGGLVAITVEDDEHEPLSDINVVIFPVETGTQRQLADVLITKSTDQFGTCSITSLAPGNYMLLATSSVVDRTVESTTRVWRARSQAKQIAIEPNETSTVSSLTVTELD